MSILRQAATWGTTRGCCCDQRAQNSRAPTAVDGAYKTIAKNTNTLENSLVVGCSAIAEFRVLVPSSDPGENARGQGLSSC